MAVNRIIPLTVAEYFAGIGLVRMGLESLQWQVSFANDISVKKYDMYKAFFPNSEQHYQIDDIFNIDPSSVPQTTLATCSFPCIDLSLAGNMNGIQGEHSSAFWGFTRIIETQVREQIAPLIVLVENVPGWLHSNNGNDFRITVEALNNLGYSCDAFVLDALRFTPQSRPRVFLIGTRNPISPNGLDGILNRPKSLLSESLKGGIVANSDLNWFSLHIPEPPPKHRDGLSRIIEQMEETDQRWWQNAEVERHVSMMNETHYAKVAQLINDEGVTYRTFFRRRRNGQQKVEVRSDEIAGCLRTAVGGSGKQFLIRAGNGALKMRAMTPREYARLQGVPDRYPINVNGVQALTGFGDAVCVPAISWIAHSVLTPLIEQFTLQPNFELMR